jgi:DNA-binding response OmpR family regulator
LPGDVLVQTGETPPPLAVLIIEDQHDIAETLRLFLEALGGYVLSWARDGEAGVRAALASPPGAVVCDVGLPLRDGFDVAEELTARLPRTPLLIAVTGYGAPEVEERAMRSGFHHFFVKPADPCEIERLLRDHRARLADEAG